MRNLKILKFIFLTASMVSSTLFSLSALAAPPINGTDDATIQQSVTSKISADTSVSGANVQVETKDGVVFLTGKTNTDKEAATIVEIAESTSGVKEVDTSNLRTEKSAHPLDDTLITAKVKGVFTKNKLFGDTTIPITQVSVETKNGVVYLTGSVKNKNQAAEAVNLAKQVKGVKKVVSKVTIDETM